MIFHLDDIQIASDVETNFVRFVHRGGSRWSAIAGVAFLAVARDGGQLVRLPIESPHAMVADLGDVERIVGTDFNAERLIDVDLEAALAAPLLSAPPAPATVSIDSPAAASGTAAKPTTHIVSKQSRRLVITSSADGNVESGNQTSTLF